jgi:hypothetical protein
MTTSDELIRAALYVQARHKGVLEPTIDPIGRQAYRLSRLEARASGSNPGV